MSNADNPRNEAQQRPGAAESPPAGAENQVEAAQPAADSAKHGARKDFGDELRAWRMHLGLTQVGLGAKIRYSGSFVSDVERCWRMPTLEFAQACDREMGLPGTLERAFRRFTLESFPGWFAPVIPFETQAIKILNWDMRYIPGLLQTADYARALCRAGRPNDAQDLIERTVAARMQRQEIFRGEHPPSAWFIIDESVLRRGFGSQEVMAAQLDKLIEMSKQPGIVIQIMPATAIDCSGADGPMTLFDMPNSPQVVYTEGCQVGRIIDAPSEVAKLVERFDHLRAVALPPRESGRLLVETRSDYIE
jgi:hypothetical protein